MAKQSNIQDQAPIANATEATKEALFVVKGLRYATYKPEAKSYSKGHHFTYGTGAAYLDFIPGGATYRGKDKENNLITNETGKAKIEAYGKSKGYAIPSFEEVK